MAKAEVQRIDELMKEHGGNRKAVAEALGMDFETLKNKIHNNPDLKFKWSVSHSVTREMLSPAETISRKGLDIKESDLALARATQEEDDKFRDGLQGLELGAKEMSFAASLQKWQHKHFTGILDMINGGMARASLKVMMKIEELSERLAKPFEGDRALEEEQMCWESFHRACENLGKMAATAQDGAMIRAKIEQIKKLTAEGAKKKGKPGFGPQTAVQINVSDKQVEVKQV